MPSGQWLLLRALQVNKQVARMQVPVQELVLQASDAAKQSTLPFGLRCSTTAQNCSNITIGGMCTCVCVAGPNFPISFLISMAPVLLCVMLSLAPLQATWGLRS